MWTARTESVSDGLGIRIAIDGESAPLTRIEAVRLCQADRRFRAFFTALLADAPFPAFRWETPALTVRTSTRPFEFVLLNSPGLARRPDSQAFAEHFVEGPDVVEFSNLGGDAVLIVPCPKGSPSAYGHLAAFVREAPDEQQEALWERVGHAVERRLSVKPFWLSTAGAGVSWLHVRLDDRPKYYGYEAYRRAE